MSASQRRNSLGFVIAPSFQSGARQSSAQFNCADCDEFIRVAVPAGKLNPEAIATRAKYQGWDADPWRSNRNKCPRCKAPRKREGIESVMKKSPEVIVPLKSVAATNPASALGVSVGLPATSAMGPAVEAASTPTLRALTPDQKQRVRALLDKHFDDAKGLYLDSMSDQKIAEALNVPRANVVYIREVGYGPIRISAAAVKLREDADAFLAKFDAAEARWRAELAALNIQAAEIAERQLKLVDSIDGGV